MKAVAYEQVQGVLGLLMFKDSREARPPEAYGRLLSSNSNHHQHLLDDQVCMWGWRVCRVMHGLDMEPWQFVIYPVEEPTPSCVQQGGQFIATVSGAGDL